MMPVSYKRENDLRDHVGKGDIEISHIPTEDQLADIFTKPLDEGRFCKLKNELNVIDYSNVGWTLVSCILFELVLFEGFYKNILENLLKNIYVNKNLCS